MARPSFTRERRLSLRNGPACHVYRCTRVFTREAQLSIIIGGSALEAAQTMVWLGTNRKP